MFDDLVLPIYLDYQATTPVDERVLQDMLPFFTKSFGNSASRNHAYGMEALQAVERARETVARAIKATPQDICFTSGATESINLALKGVYLATRDEKRHFITVCTEHKAVLDSMKWLETQGVEVTYLPVDGSGLLDPDDVVKALRPTTLMVSVMAVNNEIGVIQDIEAIGRCCREHDVFLMVDATQGLGKIILDVQRQNIDLLACSAHKLYGPKGIGALYCRHSLPHVPIGPLIDGGGHERGLRSGTLNVPGIVGFGKAVEISLREMKGEQQRLREMRDTLLSKLETSLPKLKVNGDLERRIPGNLNICIPGVESEALMIALVRDLAVSTGSACTTASVEPSHVLKALGRSDMEAHSSIRIGLGRGTRLAEVDFASKRIIEECGRLRSLR